LNLLVLQTLVPVCAGGFRFQGQVIFQVGRTEL